MATMPTTATSVPDAGTILTDVALTEGVLTDGVLPDGLLTDGGRAGTSPPAFALEGAAHPAEPSGQTSLFDPMPLDGAEANRLVLHTLADQFGPAGAAAWPHDDALPVGRDPLADPARGPAIAAALDRALAQALAAWRPGTIRFQPAMGLALARALASALTGHPPGSGTTERLASELATLEAAPGLWRRSMPRGLPSSSFGARRALLQGLAAPQSSASGDAGVLLAALRLSGATLSTLVAHLADNPDWQDTLRAGQRSGNGEDLVDMAIDEAMRLMPGLPPVLRQARAAQVIGGRAVPAGAIVALDPVRTHRDPEVWSTPARFDPLRFTPARVALRDGGAWIPPGGGLRAAPESALARLAVRLALGHLLGRFAIAPGSMPAWRSEGVARARDGLRLGLRSA